MENGRDYRISAVDKAFRVLDAFSNEPYKFTLSDLSAKTGLSTNQTFRLLHTLLSTGYVRQEPETKIYALGPRAFGLVPALFNADELMLASRDALDALFSQTGEIVALIAVEETGSNICIYLRNSSDLSLVPYTIGSRGSDLHAGAVGKIILATRTDEEIESYLETHSPLRVYNSHTPSTPEAVWDAILTIRHQDYAISEEEIIEGWYGIGAPVRDRRGQVVAAVTLAAACDRHGPADRASQLAGVVDAANRISSNLGYRALVALG